MLERAFDVAEYEPRDTFTAAGLEVTAVPVEHYDIDAYGFRVEGERVLAYSGDSGPCGALVELAPRRRPLRLRGDPRDAASSTAPSAGTSPRTRPRRPQRERSGCCSRTARTSCPRRRSSELAYDGLELDF